MRGRPSAMLPWPTELPAGRAGVAAGQLNKKLQGSRLSGSLGTG